MKVLTLALLFSLPLAPLAPTKPLRQPTSQLAKHSKGGRWYFAATGHAVYCYGPVMTVPRDYRHEARLIVPDLATP